MTHQQILDKIAAKHLVRAAEEDVARLVFQGMSYVKNGKEATVASYIMPKLLVRWNCVLDRNDADDDYQDKAALTLGVLLHKYGVMDMDVTRRAFAAIDNLNKKVALSDDFFRKSDTIKAFLRLQPLPLKKKPNRSEEITFYREQDVISIQLGSKFYGAYIHGMTAPNESPILEFYDGVFGKAPEWRELEGLSARGMRYNDGVHRAARYAVYGMKYLPDPAGQIHLVKSGVEKKPDGTYLASSIGSFAVSDIFGIQDVMVRLFHGEG